MNKRIKELAERAGVKIKARRPYSDEEPYNQYLESDNDFMANNHDVVIEFLEGDGLERFAELIVRECAKVIIDNEVDYPMTGAVYDGDQAKAIMKHFGVEE